MNIEKIIEAVNGRVVGDLPTVDICGIGSLDNSNSSMVSFIVKKAYAEKASACESAAVFVKAGWEIPNKTVIEVADPYLAYAITAQLFEDSTPIFGDTVSSSAQIDSTATLAKSVTVGPNSVVGANVIIGEGTKIDANVTIEKDVTIGDNCHFHSGSVIRYDVKCGNEVIISSNAVIGSEGFANAFSRGQFTRIPCFGTVVLEDRVEIGACTTVDRGNFEDTVIKAGSRIDNLVQLAHNVTVGESCGIAAQAGFAGSTTLGDRVMVGGQVGMAGHLSVGDDVFVAAQAGIASSLEGKAAYAGSPSLPMKAQRRIEMSWRKLPELIREFRTLKKEFTELKEKINNGR